MFPNLILAKFEKFVLVKYFEFLKILQVLKLFCWEQKKNFILKWPEKYSEEIKY